MFVNYLAEQPKRRRWKGEGRDMGNRWSVRNAWLKTRPMYVAMANAKKRAKEKGWAFNITDADLVVPQFCPVLGIKIEFGYGKGPQDSSPSVDRINPTLGYVKGNVRVISNRANRLRSDATIEEIKLILADEESRNP